MAIYLRQILVDFECAFHLLHGGGHIVVHLVHGSRLDVAHMPVFRKIVEIVVLRFYPSFMARRNRTQVLFVVNCMRPLTMETEDIIDLAERVQQRGRLKIDLLVNNTNLADRTEPAMIEAGEKTVLACAEKMGISRVITAGKAEVLAQCSLRTPTMTVRRYMAPEWMEQDE